MNSTKSDWFTPAALLALSFVPAAAGTVRLSQLASGANITPQNARFFAAPIPVVLHILAVIVFSILGAFQFSRGFRRRYRAWHRTAGKILIPCGLVAALSGLWMAQFYPWPPGDGALVYMERLVAGSAMVVSIVLSVRAIWARDFTTHGEWMMRAYAIGLGAGTQVLTHLPWFVLVDTRPGEAPRAVMMGAGWVINIVVAEWIIRTRRSPRLHFHNNSTPKHRQQQCVADGNERQRPYQRRDSGIHANRFETAHHDQAGAEAMSIHFELDAGSQNIGEQLTTHVRENRVRAKHEKRRRATFPLFDVDQPSNCG